jgi:endo-1,4-beta-mannosidase
MPADPEALQPGREPFRLGINYWPARTAMRWWQDFDAAETAADLELMAERGFDSVRFFLTWEVFQPAPDRVDSAMLDRLVMVADLAERAGMAIMPTLFTGHMSGANLIPDWALGGSDRDPRFRVLAGGRLSGEPLRNWYTDPVVREAQAWLAGQAAAALAGHPALWAWDLGNENSNCVCPPDRSAASDWLKRTSAAIRSADPTARVTIGLHMEDLEEDRQLGPAEAAAECDFLTMHGYPIYARWADGPTDEHLLPFLAHLTSWLGNGADVLFSEFGAPTYRAAHPRQEPVRREGTVVLLEEQVAADYTRRALAALRGAGCLGAMLWCFADYALSTWHVPPLDQAGHERSFGLWRSDGSPKPALDAVRDFAGARRQADLRDHDWIDIESDEYYRSPGAHMRRLYGRYREGSTTTLR